MKDAPPQSPVASTAPGTAGRRRTTLREHIIEVISDSGEGAQRCGQSLGAIAARMGNGIWTVEIIPAEIRPPARSIAGASGNRIRIGAARVTNGGDETDLVVAFNEQVLLGRVRAGELKPGCTILLENMRREGYELSVAKPEIVTRDIDVLRELAAHDAVAIHISVTTLDPELHRILEPRTAAPSQRLAAIAALAEAGIPVGVMVAPIVFLEPNMMGGVLLYAFAGALVGGIDNPAGAVFGGFLVGVLENLLGAFVIGNELKLAVALVIIIGVLVVKPSGFFGKVLVSRV